MRSSSIGLIKPCHNRASMIVCPICSITPETDTIIMAISILKMEMFHHFACVVHYSTNRKSSGWVANNPFPPPSSFCYECLHGITEIGLNGASNAWPRSRHLLLNTYSSCHSYYRMMSREHVQEGGASRVKMGRGQDFQDHTEVNMQQQAENQGSL